MAALYVNLHLGFAPRMLTGTDLKHHQSNPQKKRHNIKDCGVSG